MSNSFLEQLEAKPVPKKQQQIRIVVPQEGQVAINAPLVDLRVEGYDRQKLKKRLKSKGILIGLTVDDAIQPPIVLASKTTKKSTSRPKKLKKLKKRMLITGKKTGTITALTKPPTGVIKI